MEHFYSLLLFVSVAAITPGPNNIMIMASGVNFGWRRSMPHMFGICLGVPMLILALGIGAATIFERYPQVHQTIKVLGLLYICYLAWRIASATPGSLEGGRAKPLNFIEAALFQWVNPKAWVMGTSALAAYTTPGSNIGIQVAFIVLLFCLTTWVAIALWLFFGTRLKRILGNTKHQKFFNIIMAVLLVASMLPVVGDFI